MIKMVNEESQLNTLNTFIEYSFIKKKKKQKIFGILKKRKERILGVHNLDLSVKIHMQSIKGYNEKTRTGRQK